MDSSKAVVLLSGGVDSTVALYWAKAQFDEVVAVTICEAWTDKHIQVAHDVADLALVRFVSTQIYPEIPQGKLMSILSHGAQTMFTEKATSLVIGTRKDDFPGQQRLEPLFPLASQAISQGLYGDKKKMALHHPFLQRTKAEIIFTATRLDGCMEALTCARSCWWDTELYLCGTCAECKTRAMAFRDVSVADPLVVKLKAEGILDLDFPDNGYIEEGR